MPFRHFLEITDILGPETLWPYVGLIGASGGARQSAVAWSDPHLASGPIRMFHSYSGVGINN
jgi:hypothetical protein